MMRLLIYNILLLLSSLMVYGSDCPTSCVCDTVGTRGIKAKCSAFDSTQVFGLQIIHLDLSNIPTSPGLNLTSHIFANANLRRVSSIKIVNSALKEINVNAFHELYNLNDLNLASNHLGLLEPDMFANNTNLEKLSLSQNPLQYMQVEHSPYDNYFLNIPSLLELDLSGCSLPHLLPTMFTKLTSLAFLNLASNQLTDIPKETFASILELEELDLSNNKLQQLSTDMFANNTNMMALKLQNNPLTSLKGVELKNVQRLDLSFCQFTVIDEDTFAGFPNVKNLNLSGNSIISIHPRAFSNMKKLQFLDLSNNQLTGPLPSDVFVNNVQLEIIKLANNPKMNSLPQPGFEGEFSEIYFLDVSGCGLTDLEKGSLKNLNRLSTLNLNDNEIQNIKPGVLGSKISTLYLSGNKIAYLDQVSFPVGSTLRKLFLSGNPLKKLSPAYFVNTPRLTKLDVQSCELEQLWDINDSELRSLKSLRYLNVANNRITSISLKDLNYIYHIQTLVLSGNPLICNDDFSQVIKHLISQAVSSSDGTEKKMLEEVNHENVPNGPNYSVGWRAFSKNICKEKEPLVNPTYVEEDYEPEATVFPFDDIDNEETTLDPDHVYKYLPEDIFSEPVEQGKANYMWPIIIVSLSAFSIIIALVFLAAFFLRWTRQKNSYRNKIVKRHSFCNTPKLRRGGSTVYQQLYEDHNTPTTPVMTSKLQEQIGEQRTYTFPEKETNEATNTPSTQPTNNTSYLSSPFHHSNIVPESV